ncbi:hypothetical protein ACROYT_G022005 [Oculina patagonica]
MLLRNTPELFENCGVYNPEISDHYLIYGQMTEKVCKHKSKTITFRQTKNTDFELLNQELMNAPWQVGDIFASTDDQYDYWKGLFKNVIDQHAPVKRKRVREKDIPYMTENWKRALRTKRKYAKKFAQDRTVENLELKRKSQNGHFQWHMSTIDEEESRERPTYTGNGPVWTGNTKSVTKHKGPESQRALSTPRKVG